jgi:hypothetical protein
MSPTARPSPGSVCNTTPSHENKVGLQVVWGNKHTNTQTHKNTQKHTKTHKNTQKHTKTHKKIRIKIIIKKKKLKNKN